MNIYKTGGGPQEVTKVSELELNAIRICKGQFEPLNILEDDDAGYHQLLASFDESNQHIVSIDNTLESLIRYISLVNTAYDMSNLSINRLVHYKCYIQFFKAVGIGIGGIGKIPSGIGIGMPWYR